MRIRYTPRARQDIEAIHAYFVARNPAAAAAAIALIRATVENVSEHPRASIVTDDPDIRVKLVKRYRYKIFYRVTDEIAVLHIRHGSRGPVWR